MSRSRALSSGAAALWVWIRGWQTISRSFSALLLIGRSEPVYVATGKAELRELKESVCRGFDMRGKRQIWRRLGRVHEPRPLGGWYASHGAYPTPVTRADGTVRVFFSVRDERNRSNLASIDFALDGAGARAVGSIRGPLLAPGPRGAFDADGVSVTSIVAAGDALYAYYLGWSTGRSVPFTNFIGMAIANPDGTKFERRFKAPIIGRSEADPFTVGYPWVLRDGDHWRMWYGSHLAWGLQELEMSHVVKTARSQDGFHWQPDSGIAVPLAGESDPAEFAVSRPCVLRDRTGFSMWYARRNPSYRLGFAFSEDGETWTRADDAVAFSGERGDWESGEQTYPCVFEHCGRRYMLYNGDGYGRTGFGLAVFDEA